MKRQKYLQTKFLKFLIESEQQAQKETDEEENDDEIQDENIDADEVIESLYERLKKTSQEYDDIIYGRK